jgi:hypothetical protein
MTKLNQDFTIWQGETISLQVPITDGDGNPAGLAGADVTWKATAGSASLTKTGTVIDINDTNDGVQIDLDTDDTKSLSPNRYRHECRVVDGTGDHNVVFEGVMVLKASSTKPA